MNEFNNDLKDIKEEENKEEIIKDIKIKRNVVLVIIIYILFQYILGGFFTIIFARGYANANSGLEYDMLIKLLTTNDFTNYSEAYQAAALTILIYTNFLCYVGSLIAIVLLLKEVFVEDFIKIIKKPKFYAIFIPVAAVLTYLIALGVDKLVALASPYSTNQVIIVNMLKSGNGWIMALAVIIIAPIIEEFIFRYGVFKLTKKIHIALAYAASIILFTLPHMLSTDINSVGIGVWLIQCIPYASSAFMFAFIYHKSDNIYTSIAAHMLNNLMSVVLIFI